VTPAAIVALAPIVAPRRTAVPPLCRSGCTNAASPATRTSSSSAMPPQIFTPAAIDTRSPRVEAASISAWSPMSHPAPMRAPAPTRANAPIRVSSPTSSESQSAES